MESCVDIFKIVIGPSSSRTVGPMRAACNFISQLKRQDTLPLLRNIEIELFGALSLSRKCHNVDAALYLGLLGNQPEKVDLRMQLTAIRRAENDGMLDVPAPANSTVTVAVSQRSISAL